MQFKDIADKIIRGYDYLSSEEKAVFENFPAGKKFVVEAEELCRLLDNEVDQQAGENLLWRRSEELLSDLRGNAEYKSLVTQIAHHAHKENLPKLATYCLLEANIPASIPLSSSEKWQYAEEKSYQKLCRELLTLDTGIQELEREYKQKVAEYRINFGLVEVTYSTDSLGLTDKKNELVKERDNKIEEWLAKLSKQISEQRELKKQREESVQKLNEAEQRLTSLAQKFPLLLAQPSFVELRKKSDEEFKRGNPNPEKLQKIAEEAEIILAQLLLSNLQKLTHQYLSFISLDDLNQKEANRLAHEIFEAFNKRTVLELDTWLANYRIALEKSIEERLLFSEIKLLGNTKEEQPAGSLSFIYNLFITPELRDQVKNYANRIGDAHAFMQSAGLASQNDNSFAFIVDLYNVARHEKKIAEGKAVMMGLLSPFSPLLLEYTQIACYEKNFYRKIFRMVMPLIIIVGVIGILTLPLTFWALPEVVVLLAFIPALIIALAVATKYVTMKNGIYDYFNQLWWGGAYNIEEYQVNDRMIKIFGTKEMADEIRKIYIREMERCDKLEAEYKAKYEKGTLSEAEQGLREANKLIRDILNAGWYDARENIDLLYEKAPEVVIKNLSILIAEQLKEVADKFENDLPEIKTLIKQMEAGFLETVFPEQEKLVDSEEKKVEQDVVSQESSLSEAKVIKIEVKQEREKLSMSPGRSAHGFFPSCMPSHNKAKELLGVMDQVKSRHATLQTQAQPG